MFDQLSDRLSETLSDVRSRGKLTEADVDKAMREIRLALLEADVNFKVVRSFTKQLKERSLESEILDALNPGQQVVKIVNEELTALMGGEAAELELAPKPPTVILMAGLQGAGKTTACAKLAKLLRADGKKVALAACDTQRPAAVEQLVTMGERAGATVYRRGTDADPADIAEWALNEARSAGQDVLIVDTAGRLHVDADLMDQLVRVHDRTKPDDVLLVLDSMTGQDAVNVAESFAERVDFDGVLLTKLDGDARGGAALSVRAVTGKPVMFVSTGEGIDQLERFHPERMAGRILGMGDVLSLIERAEELTDAEQQAELERKIRKQEFTLEDFLTQMRQVRKMGPLSSVLGMMPGMGKAMKQIRSANMDERELDRVEAIILSMTPYERAHPEVIKGSRRKRIAQGSGTTIQAVNNLVKQFAQMKKMMAALSRGKMPDPQALLRGMR
ncbi:signal recognition particle protein [Thermoleophilia bacterium SCSIO 60948]|nr:signal recognition particle protein [Thermoleophilia bacterium SCSIO 60948]